MHIKAMKCVMMMKCLHNLVADNFSVSDIFSDSEDSVIRRPN